MPAIPMNPSFSQTAGQVLNQVIDNWAQEQHKKAYESKLNNALQQAQQIEMSNLPPQQKVFEQAKLLNAFPEVMKFVSDQQYRQQQFQQKANEQNNKAAAEQQKKFNLENARKNAYGLMPKPSKAKDEEGNIIPNADYEGQRDQFFQSLLDPNLPAEDRNFLTGEFQKRFPEEKPLTQYQQQYLDLQKEIQQNRKHEFALRFENFRNMNKRDQIKVSDDFYNTQIKTNQSLLKNPFIKKQEIENIKKEINDLQSMKQKAAQKILKGKALSLEKDYGIAEDEELDEEDVLDSLSDEEIDDLLEEAEGNIPRARQLAIERYGYGR